MLKITINQRISTTIRRVCFTLGFNITVLTISAQSDYDTTTDYNDLNIVEEKNNQDEYEDQENYFIQKEDRYYEWQPLSQRNIPDSIKKKTKEEDAYWYADMAAEKKPEKDYRNNQNNRNKSSWLQGLIWIVIIAGFIAFLGIYLSGSSVGLFRKRNVPISNEDEEQMPEDIFAINYQKEIDNAAAKGNYRLAVRLMFLRLLKNMSERNIINYKQDKTNFDYLTELHTSAYYQSFFKLTRNYEYSWYGQFEISENTYQLIRRDFDIFNQQWK